MIIKNKDDYYKETQNKRSGLDFNNNEILNYLIEIKSYNPSISSFLDIGCRGHAATVKHFMSIGIDSYGIDIGDDAERQWNEASIPKRENLIKCDVHNGIPIDKHFDLISMSHILEHLYDVPKVLEYVMDKLTENGIVWSIVPLENNANHHPHYTVFTNHDEHISIFTSAGFNVLWDNEGFNGQPCSYIIASK